MLKRSITALLAALCLLTFAACGKEMTPEPTAPTGEVTEAPTEAPTEEPTEAPTEEPTEAPTEAPTKAPDTPAGSYVNFDKMQFTVNGKTYTLGETTLQTMIDDGVPFEKDDLANAGNNLNKHTQSQRFRIVLGQFWTAQVYVMNSSDENKTMSECCINAVNMNYRDGENQNIISFAFPEDLTMDDLKANAGEPTEYDHYDSDDSDYYSDTLKYEKESTQYFRDLEYRFEFAKGKLRTVYMQYYP